MTINEVIERLQGHYVNASMRASIEEVRAENGAINMAISALRAQQEAEKNEPLTKEEMDWCRKNHKPVWIEVLCSRYKESGWALAGTRAAIKQDVTPEVLWYEEYGECWIAYRRPPKEAE